MTILIGTPAYGHMVHTDYLHSLISFSQRGISYVVFTIGNESLITRARNSIISYFYANRENYTHLLFLDADIQLPSECLQRMLDLDKDVVAAPVPLKGSKEDGSPIFNVGSQTRRVAEDLYTTDRVGTAVLLLSSHAVEALIGRAEEQGLVYENQGLYAVGQAWSQCRMYDVFRVGIVDEEYLSEDFWVCRELRRLGFEIHLDGKAEIVHNGMHSFRPL